MTEKNTVVERCGPCVSGRRLRAQNTLRVGSKKISSSYTVVDRYTVVDIAPTYAQKRPSMRPKETQCVPKRDPVWAQKRPSMRPKETQCVRKRDPVSAQTRPET